MAGDYWWYATYAGDSNNNAATSACTTSMVELAVAKASPTLSASGPTTGTAGTPIATSAISATLAGSSGANANGAGSISFYAVGPTPTEPSSCPGSATAFGTATPAGNGVYNPSSTFTATVAGDYWWYATYAGDSNDNAATSACATSMVELVVGAAPA